MDPKALDRILPVLIGTVLGAALWVPSMTLTGYYFGKAIPANSIDLFFIGLVVLMVAASTAPALFHLWRERRKGHAAQ